VALQATIQLLFWLGEPFTKSFLALVLNERHERPLFPLSNGPGCNEIGAVVHLLCAFFSLMSWHPYLPHFCTNFFFFVPLDASH
jgi:hypothetical protein